MKRQSKYVERTEYEQLSRVFDQYSRMLNNLVNKVRPDAVEKTGWLGGGRYTLTLYRATGPEGGLAVMTFETRNTPQAAYSVVRLLDELSDDNRLRPPTDETTAIAIALERLRAARTRLRIAMGPPEGTQLQDKEHM